MKILPKLARFSFFLFLIASPFGQLARLPFSFLPPEVHLYLTDLFLFFTLFIWFSWHFLSKKKIIFPSLVKPILIFFSFALLSLFINLPRLNQSEGIISSLYLLRWLLYAGLYFFVFDYARQFKTNYFKIKNFALTLASLGIILALFGLIQYLLWPDLRTFEVAHWDPHYYRVVSTFLDPGFTGLILVFTLALLAGIYAQKPQRRLVFLGALVYLALALTYSRSSFLAFLFAAGTLSWLKKRGQIFLIALLLVVFTLLFLPRQPGGEGVKLERWASIEARLINWQQSLKIFADHPFFGVGFNTYRYAQKDYGFLKNDWRQNHAGAGADSSFLFVLATTGLFGFFAYLNLWREAFRLVYSRSSFSFFALSLLAVFWGLWSHSFFLNSQFYPWVMAWVWLLLGSLEVSKTEYS